jgi:organic hydroperoxide reductase OsmC/OhrA
MQWVSWSAGDRRPARSRWGGISHAATCTAVVDVNGEGRTGGHVRSSGGLLETGLALPKELGGAGTATNPVTINAAA